MSSLAIFTDLLENRISASRDRLTAVVDGRKWDIVNSTDLFLDYVTKTVILAPLPWTAEWQEEGDAPYNRLRKANYTLISPGKWREHTIKHNKDYFLHSLDINEQVYTNESLERNRGMFLAWQAYNSGSSRFVQMECSWAEGSDADVRLRFWSTGEVEIYRNLEFVGRGNIFESVKYPVAFGSGTTSIKGAKAKQQAGETIEVLLIPCRRRELLILSNQGGGFNYRFEDIDEDDPDPTITGAGKFGWYVPEGQATVQAALLKFRESGNLLSLPYRLRYAPRWSQEATVTYTADTPGYGTQEITPSLVETDGTTEFEPDAVKQDVRLRAEITGDGKSTPFLYALSVVFDPVLSATPSLPSEIEDLVTEMDYSVGEGAADTEVNFTVLTPDSAAFKLHTISNRSVQIFIADGQLIWGRTHEPELTEARVDALVKATLKIHDRWHALEEYRFQDPEPLDGLTLSEAMYRLVKLTGYRDVDIDIDESSYVLPSVAAASEGEYALLPEVGDTAAEWILKLWETYARTAVIGFHPNGVFKFRLKENLPTEPAAILYPTDATAVSVGGYLSGTWPSWYRSFHQTTLPCEANYIQVVGRDPRTKLPIISYYEDTASTDPTTAVLSRPDNWLGEAKRYAWIDAALNTIEHTNYVCGILRERLTPVRKVAEWECQLLFDEDGALLWKGDLVGLYGLGVYRIISYSGRHEVEISPTRFWSPYTYVGEYVGSL